jgi:hypothetical protein
MPSPAEPTPAKYFAGLLSSDVGLLDRVETDLFDCFGPVENRSATTPWTESRFYEREMGDNLVRRFISFAPLRSPERLAEFKVHTREVEDRYRRSEPARGRQINIDPGYLDRFKVVLASTKNAGQRIYLGAGIFGEATLMYYDGAWHGLPYTYRDYLWPQAHRFLSAVRETYLLQLRQPA